MRKYVELTGDSQKFVPTGETWVYRPINEPGERSTGVVVGSWEQDRVRIGRYIVSPANQETKHRENVNSQSRSSISHPITSCAMTSCRVGMNIALESSCPIRLTHLRFNCHLIDPACRNTIHREIVNILPRLHLLSLSKSAIGLDAIERRGWGYTFDYKLKTTSFITNELRAR